LGLNRVAFRMTFRRRASAFGASWAKRLPKAAFENQRRVGAFAPARGAHAGADPTSAYERARRVVREAKRATDDALGAPRRIWEDLERRGEKAKRGARATTDRVLGRQASEFLWTMSELNPVVVKRAAEQTVVSALDRHWKKIEAIGTLAGGLALWRACRGFKTSVLGVPSESGSFDVAFGDPSMLGGSLLFAMAGAFALRQRYRLDIDHACALAMRRLETHAGVREILGAPVVAGESRVAVTSGGGLALFKRTRSRFFGAVTLPVSVDSKWAHVAFELRGTRKRGIVSMGARKWAGEYGMPLLALEVKSFDGEIHRVFLEGGAKDYEVSSVLASLRAPLEASVDLEMKRAKSLSDALAAEIAAQELATRRAATAPKPLDQGGGMHPHERAYDYAANALHFVRSNIARVRVSSK